MFAPEELEAVRHLTAPPVQRPERPFDLDRCLDLYESGLPRSETRTTQAWRTQRWVDDWGCDPQGRLYEGLLSVDEAKFWWIAWTLTGRLGDSAERAESVDLMRTVWAAESRTTPAPKWCANRLDDWERSASDFYDVWALTSMAPSAAMLRALLGRAAALRFVLGRIPADRVGAWVEWVGAPSTNELAAYCEVADAWAATHQPSASTLKAWRALALRARTPGLVRQLRAFASSHGSKRNNDALLRDVARADTTPGAFSAWVLSDVSDLTAEHAQEMIARDADSGVAALATYLNRVAARNVATGIPALAPLVAALLELPRDELVDPMLGLLERPDAGIQARRWLRTHGVALFDRLVELATGTATTRRAALHTISELENLHPAAVADALAELPRDKRKRLREAIAPSWHTIPVIDELPEWAQKFATDISWGRGLEGDERALLPPLVVGDARLPDDVVDGVLAVLSDVRLEVDLRSGKARDEVPEALEGLRSHLTADSADRFARALFDVWLRADDHDEYRWCMRSVAFFGGDRTLEHLVAAVVNYRRWFAPEDAFSALDALRRHGSGYATTLLGWLAEKHRAPRIRAHARLELEAIANSRGESVDQVLDHDVPTLGFDDDARHSITLGDETYTLELRPGGRVVWDEDRRPARRSTTETPWESDEARDALGRIRGRVETIADLHTARWERSMTEYRSVAFEAWNNHLLRHPVLRQIARSVLWMVCDEQGVFLTAVRVGDDFELVGIDERTTTVQPWERIGVAHPAELSERDHSRWNQLFADYEIVQPFTQLDREVFRAVDAAPDYPKLDTQTLRARMARSWGARRGKNQVIVGFERVFDEPGITVRVDLADGFEIRPIAAGGLVPTLAQVESVSFHDTYDELPADAVPPGIYSEVMRDLLRH